MRIRHLGPRTLLLLVVLGGALLATAVRWASESGRGWYDVHAERERQYLRYADVSRGRGNPNAAAFWRAQAASNARERARRHRR